MSGSLWRVGIGLWGWKWTLLGMRSARVMRRGMETKEGKIRRWVEDTRIWWLWAIRAGATPRLEGSYAVFYQAWDLVILCCMISYVYQMEFTR